MTPKQLQEYQQRKQQWAKGGKSVEDKLSTIISLLETNRAVDEKLTMMVSLLGQILEKLKSPNEDLYEFLKGKAKDEDLVAQYRIQPQPMGGRRTGPPPIII